MPAITTSTLATALDTRCNVFIESGTFYGDTYRTVLDAGIFQRVYSVEIVETLHAELLKKFEQNEQQRIFLGDSRQVLKEQILPLCQPTDRLFFWLDAHYSGGPTGGEQVECPLLGELDAILQAAPSKNLVIAVDDIDELGRQDDSIPGLNWPTREEVEALVYQINPDFHCLDFTGEGDYERQGRGVLIYSDRPLSPQFPQAIAQVKRRMARTRTIQRYRQAITRRLNKLFGQKG